MKILQKLKDIIGLFKKPQPKPTPTKKPRKAKAPK